MAANHGKHSAGPATLASLQVSEWLKQTDVMARDTLSEGSIVVASQQRFEHLLQDSA